MQNLAALESSSAPETRDYLKQNGCIGASINTHGATYAWCQAFGTQIAYIEGGIRDNNGQKEFLSDPDSHTRETTDEFKRRGIFSLVYQQLLEELTRHKIQRVIIDTQCYSLSCFLRQQPSTKMFTKKMFAKKCKLSYKQQCPLMPETVWATEKDRLRGKVRFIKKI